MKHSSLEQFTLRNNQAGFETARVVAEHKERYTVASDTGEYDAVITGNLRYTAQSREDFPAVGDWVAIAVFEQGQAIIHQVGPRTSVIKRQSAGHTGEFQVIAANIDYALVVQSVDRDFNINRMERYLAICHSAPAKPVILLTKTDLVDETRLAEITGGIQKRISGVPVIAVSNETQCGYSTLKESMESSMTYCMLGSSGVGKSTLLNNLTGNALMRTGSLSSSTRKGRHTTSHRELFVLDNGSFLIDNPGMREVGTGGTGDGVESAFSHMAGLAPLCRYKDCTHTQEAGCAVIRAVEEGTLSRASYENFLKMEREKAHFEATVAERHKKEKAFGKILKNYKKEMGKKS